MSHGARKTAQHLLYSRCFYLLTGLLVVTGCAPRPAPSGWLADQYNPTASAPNAVEVPLQNVIQRDGDHRVHWVQTPNGQRARLYWEKRSESIGGPSQGRLVDGRAMPTSGPGYRQQGEDEFGTDETVAYLQFAAGYVAQAFPNAAPLWIQDLSRANGGPLRPHRSHQSGRDVDVGLYRKDGRFLRRFTPLPLDEIDMERTWAFVEALLRTGAVRYIFMDRRLQVPVRDFARSVGWPEPWLNRVFESGGGNRRSIIRHIRGHRDHLHIRFRCPPEDSECVE